MGSFIAALSERECVPSSKAFDLLLLDRSDFLFCSRVNKDSSKSFVSKQLSDLSRRFDLLVSTPKGVSTRLLTRSLLTAEALGGLDESSLAVGGR